MNNPYRHPALRFLKRFCPPELFEGIAGDLEEQFDSDMQSFGAKEAGRKLTWSVLTFFRPGILLRNKFKLSSNNTIMIRSYVKIAARNMLKRKVYSFINAFGLSIGIAFCALIYLFIRDEQSFDLFHLNKDRIYRLEGRSLDTRSQDTEERYHQNAWLQLGARDAIKAEIPEIEFATRFNPGYGCVFRYGTQIFNENVTFVDNDFFSMFSFGVISGNPTTMLKRKNEVVLTPGIVEKYFGDSDPVGKTITLDIAGEKELIVVGVIENPPANSSLEFEVLVSIELRQYYDQAMTQWSNFNTPVFFQLYHGASERAVKSKLDKIVEAKMKKNLEQQRLDATYPIPEDAVLFEYIFTKLPDIHLKSEVGWTRVSDTKYSWILGGIALLILLIACINYVSLALTTSVSRRTEVGIRKVVGAQKKQLVYQFSFESILLALISMIIGIGLAILFLPTFSSFTGKAIVLSPGLFADLTLSSLALSILVGLISGSYPALFLSAFRPAAVLKGRFTSKLQAGFTKPLVVLQFALAAFLIISSMIMYRQMRFITTKDLGFSKSQILVVPTQAGWNNESDRSVTRYRTRLEQDKQILAVAGVSSSFNKGYSQYGYKIGEEYKAAYVYGVDPSYLPLLDISLVAGRNFDDQIVSDSSAVIVNESLVRDMKWKDPLNEYLNWRQDSTSLGSKVIGVVRDYHFQALSEEISPMFLSMNTREVGHLEHILVKVAPGNIPETVDLLRKRWSEIFPTLPFDYSFLDDDVARQYESYERWMNIMGISTTFAILISCLGLFGLSGVNAINRTKEIGIRKVMGAEIASIFFLLNKQYLTLSLLSSVLAIPAAWYAMHKWLSDFKFAIDMGWDLFAISVLAGLVISMATVSYHAVRTALLNPADTLKYE